MRRETNACFPKVLGPNISPCPVRENSPNPGFRLSARAFRLKNGEPQKSRRIDRKSVPPTTARAPAGMTVRLKIRGPGEPRKPKAGTLEKSKNRLKNYPPFRGIFITPGWNPELVANRTSVYTDGPTILHRVQPAILWAFSRLLRTRFPPSPVRDDRQ